MNCDEAALLLCARIDGELNGAEPCRPGRAEGSSLARPTDLRSDRGDAALDAHLAGCQACRQTLVEMELADAAMLRAFSSRKETAVALADRVLQSLAGYDTKAHRVPQAAGLRRNLTRWAGWGVAAAAGFLAAMVFLNPRDRRMAPPHALAQVQPVAHMTLATGAVFTCPSDQHDWRPVSPGDPIDLGAAVRTADASKCELQFPDGSCVRLNKATNAWFAGDRTVRISAGQVWSAVARNASPLHVSAGETHVTACSTGDDGGAKFDMSCAANSATVTVQQGSADVSGNGSHITVHGGQFLHAPSATTHSACATMPDPLLSSAWQDELLVLKPADDPELAARVDQLVSRIATDRRMAEGPGPAEQHVRANGPAWSAAMVFYLRTRPAGRDRDSRRTAARLLAEFAPPSCIPDLIDLTGDSDSEVRHQADVALRRLTGQTPGSSLESDHAAWCRWWEQNKGRYSRRS